MRVYKIVLIILHVYYVGFAFHLNKNINQMLITQSQKNTEPLKTVLDISTIAQSYEHNTMENYWNSIYNSSPDNNELFMNITELVKCNGFDIEEHEVETEDGYGLSIFRIHGNGPTVFLMHGILLSADDWVTAGRETGLAYLLAERGFDVWMGNARGNKHSRRHKTLSPETDAAQFFDFSFYEIGIYDLPAMIDYVLEVTNLSELYYVGHSEGTTSFFVMCSERPEYNLKISLMIALAPAGAIPHTSTPLFQALKLLTHYQPHLLFSGLRVIGYNEFLADSMLLRFFTIVVCGNIYLRTICNSIVGLVAGFDYSQANYTALPTIYSHAPAGVSMKQLEHFAQSVSSGTFSKFDYGRNKNLDMYGSHIPPEFPTNKITAPIALLYGKNDKVATAKDLFTLRKKILSVIITYEIPYAKFNHFDFIYAKDFKTLVFPMIIKLMSKVEIEVAYGVGMK